ncbi:MAG: heavy-metal-associated domain-containing protein [Geodermatophilaceae bacterium]
MTSQSYMVIGMSCQHCVNAVSEEVRAIDGVTDVKVDLDGGGLTVTSTGPLPAAPRPPRLAVLVRQP